MIGNLRGRSRQLFHGGGDFGHRGRHLRRGGRLPLHRLGNVVGSAVHLCGIGADLLDHRVQFGLHGLGGARQGGHFV